MVRIRCFFFFFYMHVDCCFVYMLICVSSAGLVVFFCRLVWFSSVLYVCCFGTGLKDIFRCRIDETVEVISHNVICYRKR